MKIRILTQNPFSVWFGWVEQQALKYIESVKKNDSNIDISIFSWEEESFDVLHIIGIHGWINPYWIQVLQKKGVKIVVSPVFYVQPNSLFDFRRPFVYKLFSYIPHHVVAWMRQLLTRADLILPNSYAEKIHLQQIFPSLCKNIEIIHNGVDPDYFVWADPALAASKYALWDYILSVSHLEPRKNHKTLIKYFIRYIKQNPIRKIKLVLVWDYRGNYFSYHKELEKLIGENQDSILHISWLSNSSELLKSLYLGAKAHILLSSLETPGISNIEAALAWKQLLVWDCDPVREYFSTYASYLKKEDEKWFTYFMDSLLNPKLENTKEQIDFILDHYTWDKIGSQLINYYKNLCEVR